MKKVLLGFASAAVLSIGCGGGGTNNGGDCTTATTGASLKLVADTVTLPKSSDASKPDGFGMDLNGDKTPENKLGGLLSILNGVSTSGSGPQSSVDAAIKTNGTFILLMSLSADSLATSKCAGVTVSFGDTKPNGVFDGTGTFTAAAGTSSTLNGPIAGGVLNTNDPTTADSPFDVNVKLPLITGAAPIELKLTAAHITGTVDATGKKITAGKINGAIKNSDLRNTVLPGVAAALTAILNDASAEATTKTAIKSLLDKGCTAAGTTAMANDNKIDTCEVSDGALKSALTPDLDLYSDTTKAADGSVVGSYGVYDPKPSTATAVENDALSFGVGFTAVGASF